MADERLFRSNGTCYIGPGVRADDSFIPCGNDLFGRKTCCGAGDMCLSSRACYSNRFGLTYLLGCSDPQYQHESCPKKLDAPQDNPWVGLVYCNGTSEQWVACPQQAKEKTLAKPDACYCPTTSRTVAFTDKSILENIVSLPTALGGSVVWQAGHVPIATATDASSSPSSTSSSGGSQTTDTPAPSTGTPQPEPGTGLSTGAKVGISVGVSIGAILILAAVISLILVRRRRKRVESEAQESNHGESGKMLPMQGTPATPSTSVPSELEPTAARPWSLRSELESRTPGSLFEAEGHPYGAPRPYPGARGPQNASELPG